MKTIRKGDRGDDVRLLQRLLHLWEDGIFGAITEEAVMAFQKSKGLTPVDGIVGQKTWAALQGVNGYTKRTINEIIVHCTATKEGQNVTVSEIDKWHRQRGFAGIGYHYVVYLDGSIHDGRSVTKAGAHCTGHNQNSIGVCYVGGLDKYGRAKDTRNDAQKAALLNLLKRLKALYPLATIHGHREYANKDCPCFDAKNEYRNL